MKSLDVANYLIDHYGHELGLTNLKLNKLVYFAQVASLRRFDEPLFDDAIQAWDFGPVEPLVYRVFNRYGRSIIANLHGSYEENERLRTIIDQDIVPTYGNLTAFDLVQLSHQPEGAWETVFEPRMNRTITVDDIRQSADMRLTVDTEHTLASGIATVQEKWPNTLRMLENS